jgi:hypothetical protein
VSLNGKLRNPVAVLIVTMSLTGCGSTPVGSSIPGDATRSLSSVPEIMPGVLQGYLTDKDQLDSRVFVSSGACVYFGGSVNGYRLE